MSELILIDRPEKDWEFQIGDFCVLNSGSPILEVIAIKSNGDRVLKHEEDTFEFPSICLRPHFLDRILMR